MSTYAIASAIEKLAKNFKEVMDDKNQIEREKLEFEKEKFKLLTFQEETRCNHEWKYNGQNSAGHNYICSKCGKIKLV